MEQIMEILRDINPDIDYVAEKALIDDGFFSSLEIMSIIVALSDQLKIDVDPSDITVENFNSAEAILQLIEKYK